MRIMTFGGRTFIFRFPLIIFRNIVLDTAEINSNLLIDKLGGYPSMGFVPLLTSLSYLGGPLRIQIGIHFRRSTLCEPPRGK